MVEYVVWDGWAKRNEVLNMERMSKNCFLGKILPLVPGDTWLFLVWWILHVSQRPCAGFGLQSGMCSFSLKYRCFRVVLMSKHHPIVYHPAFCFRKHFYVVEGERPCLEYNSQSPGLGTDLGKPMELAALWSSTHCSGRALALLLTRNVTSGRVLTWSVLQLLHL